MAYDTCPCLTRKVRAIGRIRVTIKVWCDYEDPEKRESDSGFKFNVTFNDRMHLKPMTQKNWTPTFAE